MKSALSFYDIKKKTKFSSIEWAIQEKTTKGRTRYFAVAKVPGEAREAWLIVSKDFATANKGM
ncbi:MAG: hypothetical protein ACRDHG_08145 [Anaerolineales bacterium]